MRKILLAIEGSDGCKKAAKKAQELALFCKSELTFLTVAKFENITTAFTKEDVEHQMSEIEKQKQEAIKPLEECKEIYNECENALSKEGLSAKKVILEGGNPAAIICDYAEKNRFDLIVLSDKGKSNVKKFLLGSTTEKVVRYAKTSVLVVK